jgi:DNA ligase-1
MQAFAALLDRLYFTYSNNKKIALLTDFFATTPDPERGYAIAMITGELQFPSFKRGLIKELIHEQIDPHLFMLSYDYVGDMSETVALLWKTTPSISSPSLPPLSKIIQQLLELPKSAVKDYLKQLLNQANVIERWALLKLGSTSLRIGVSSRFIKQALAQYGNRDIQEIEQIWHGLQPPYLELFSWLENKIPKPNIADNLYFHPVMLAQPLDESELEKIQPDLFAIERKIDGIRVQFIHTAKGKALFSRTGDDISAAFPEILQLNFPDYFVLDGELVIKKYATIGSFNDLQKRLNRKTPSKNLIKESPAHIILYDILLLQQRDVRNSTFIERRELLERWYENNKSGNLSLSDILPFRSSSELLDLKVKILATQDIAVEGLMIKRKLSTYLAGRPSGQWYKWKRDPYLIDAVLMYAQRGHGKRSSFYSDYTFGLWHDGELLPIGKAYFGFTDEELKRLDRWIRNNTKNRFGPVREVLREMVFEIAFDAVNVSARHKSGFALRFPRINRIRWDKPAAEADELVILKKYLT